MSRGEGRRTVTRMVAVLAVGMLALAGNQLAHADASSEPFPATMTTPSGGVLLGAPAAESGAPADGEPSAPGGAGSASSKYESAAYGDEPAPPGGSGPAGPGDGGDPVASGSGGGSAAPGAGAGPTASGGRGDPDAPGGGGDPATPGDGGQPATPGDEPAPPGGDGPPGGDEPASSGGDSQAPSGDDSQAPSGDDGQAPSGDEPTRPGDEPPTTPSGDEPTPSGDRPAPSGGEPTDPASGGGAGGGAEPTTAAERYGWGTPLPASDEFNYTGPPDPQRWNTAGECWAGHDGHGKRCASRSTVDGSKLVQTGLENGDSAWVASKLDQQYGRWEARVRSTATGPDNGRQYHPLLIVWPASNLWPEDGEYDFLENGAPGQDCAESFMHYPHDAGVAVQQIFSVEEDCGAPLSEWHNVAFEWTPDHLRGFIDGKKWFDVSGGANENRRNIQDMPSGHLTIQLDNFFGGSMQPATYEVDWVRIYALPGPDGGRPDGSARGLSR